MTSKELLEQDYIKICPECGDLASKESDTCENCNHDLSQEPLYDTNDFSEIKRISQEYKNREIQNNTTKSNTIDEVVKNISQNNSEQKSTDIISDYSVNVKMSSNVKRAFIFSVGIIVAFFISWIVAYNASVIFFSWELFWGISAICLPIVLLICAAIAPPKQSESFSATTNESATNAQVEMLNTLDAYVKICPYCGDRLLALAETCPTCKHDISNVKPIPKSNPNEIKRCIDKAKLTTPNETPISCPKCGCTHLSANKKGFSYWTGAIGSQKVYITCLRCGHRWKAGDRR